MAPTTRKPLLTRKTRELQAAQLRPRPHDEGQPEEQFDKPSPAKRARMESPSEEQPEPFRLMDLAPELRILVYEMVLENHPTAKLSRSSARRELSSTSAMPRVSKQVRDEFLNVVMTSVPIVETLVSNFQFGHIVTFLNRLSDIDLARMTSANATRTLRITLDFHSSTPNVPQLYRWLNRSEHPTKKGSKIDFQYVCPRAKLYSHYDCTRFVRNSGDLEAVKILSALQQR